MCRHHSGHKPTAHLGHILRRNGNLEEADFSWQQNLNANQSDQEDYRKPKQEFALITYALFGWSIYHFNILLVSAAGNYAQDYAKSQP